MVADRTANQRLLAHIGFGEAVDPFMEGWEIAGARIGAYGIKTQEVATRDGMEDRYARFAVTGSALDRPGACVILALLNCGRGGPRDMPTGHRIAGVCMVERTGSNQRVK